LSGLLRSLRNCQNLIIVKLYLSGNVEMDSSI
jgi:hypothetical protein